MPDDPSDVILALEQRRYQAMIDSDPATLERLCAAELVYTHTNTSKDDKTSLLKKLADGVLDYEWIEHPIDRVIIEGDTALVLGEVHGRVVSAGIPKDLHNLVLAVWIRRTDGWRLIAHHPTPIP
jgi:hypothetical protein